VPVIRRDLSSLGCLQRYGTCTYMSVSVDKGIYAEVAAKGWGRVLVVCLGGPANRGGGPQVRTFTALVALVDDSRLPNMIRVSSVESRGHIGSEPTPPLTDRVRGEHRDDNPSQQVHMPPCRPPSPNTPNRFLV
jgi:hypothetical protein